MWDLYQPKKLITHRWKKVKPTNLRSALLPEKLSEFKFADLHIIECLQPHFS
jgi:hypothetical protein